MEQWQIKGQFLILIDAHEHTKKATNIPLVFLYPFADTEAPKL
jgi:hypothetical protein